jgi:hypothetical protein
MTGSGTDALGWYPVGTNPQLPMNTLDCFKASLSRFRGFAEKGNRDPAEIAIALRVLSDPGLKPRGKIDGAAELFTGGDADWMGDTKALGELGVGAVDVRLTARTLEQTFDNMRRFRDGVLANL